MSFKVLLIEAGNGEAGNKADVIPLNLLYPASFCDRFLNESGIDIEVCDLRLKNELKSIDRKIEKAKIIGISCYTHNYNIALKILRKAKSIDREKVVIAGGPHVTSLYREALEHGFDAVIRGEGEHAFYGIIKAFSKGKDFRRKNIPGIAFKKNSKIFVNPVKRINDLDKLPFPARKKIDIKSYYFPGAIATSRGCIYLCKFCAGRNQSGFLRLRSVESLLNELEEIKMLGINSFFVIDPNFAFDKKRVIKFCRRAKKLGMHFYAELRLDQVDEEIIKALSDADCRVVRFGIESGSQDMVEIIRKGINLEELLYKVKLLVKHGIKPICGFMIGLPKETEMHYKKTLEIAREIVEIGGEVNFAILTPYPGTYIYRNAEKLGIKIKTKNWQEYHYLNPVIETENFKREELRRMLFNAMLYAYGIRLDENISFNEEKPEIIELRKNFERKSLRKLAAEFEA